MRKGIIVLLMVFGISQVSNAQLSFGVKGGVNYNLDANIENTQQSGTDVFNGAKGKSGFHAGVWLRGKLPIIGLYLRPELVYTQIKSEFTNNQGTISSYDLQKIDVPVLLGTKILGVLTAFAGPSFQYVLDSKFDAENLSTDDFDKFSMGLQLGAGIEFGKLGIDVRWEKGLSESQANIAGGDFKVDNRTNQIIFGLSLKL